MTDPQPPGITTTPITEEELAELEKACADTNGLELTRAHTRIAMEVPRLIAEVRRLRALLKEVTNGAVGLGDPGRFYLEYRAEPGDIVSDYLTAEGVE